MESALARHRRNMTQQWLQKIPRDPPAYSEMDCGYSSLSSSDPSERVSKSISDSDWSKDSPPNFQPPPIRETTTTTTSNISPVEVAVFLIVVATVLYFACSLFSREPSVTQYVNIVLPSCSGEQKSTEVIEKLMNQLVKQGKEEIEMRVRFEIQADGDKRQVMDDAEDSVLMSIIKFFFLVLTIFFMLGFFSSYANVK